MTRACYPVKIQSKCEFDDAVKPDLLAYPLSQQSPLRTHDGRYGFGNEAMCVHYKARENEVIKYVDVMNLYPYLYKDFKFPVGHTIIHVGMCARI